MRTREEIQTRSKPSVRANVRAESPLWEVLGGGGWLPLVLVERTSSPAGGKMENERGGLGSVRGAVWGQGARRV